MSKKILSMISALTSQLKLDLLLDRAIPKLVASAIGGDDAVARCCVICGKTEDEHCGSCSVATTIPGKKRHHYSADSSECSVGWPSCQGCAWGAEDRWECLACG